MKFTAVIVTAILAYATMATAMPMPEETTTIAPVMPVVETLLDMDTVDVSDFDKREAEARPPHHQQDNGWNNRPGQKTKREAEAKAAHRQDNGWNNRPGQKMKREAEARPPHHKQDNGWNNRPGQKMKREAEAEAAHRQDNGWNNRPGQ